MRRAVASVIVAGLACFGLTACGDTGKVVKPNSKCYRSQKGQEAMGTDGREYECRKTGWGKRSYKWKLDD